MCNSDVTEEYKTKLQPPNILKEYKTKVQSINLRKPAKATTIFKKHFAALSINDYQFQTNFGIFTSKKKIRKLTSASRTEFFFKTFTPARHL